MDTTPKQQAVDLTRRAQNILIVTHKNPDGDALGSLIALKIALEAMGKKVFIACPDEPSSIFAFLPRINEISTTLELSRDLVVSLNLKNAQVAKIGYKKEEAQNRVNIIIVPKDGQFTEEDVTVARRGPQYDLIIALDTPNFERLGKLALPTDIFYEVPVINIDHHPSNERYGKVNWVELVATSCAEILVSFLEALSKEKPLIDADVATALLTGLIYDTSSFQNVNTTPKSLTVAAQLVAAGARQQEIVKNLYKTKSVQTLKLWGQILSNVKEDKTNRFLWSTVTKEEITKTGASEAALSGVVDELLKSATDVDFVLLLSEREENQVHCSIRAVAKNINVAQIAELFAGGGHEAAAAFRVEGTISAVEGEILQKIRQFQGKTEVSAKEKELPDSSVSSSSQAIEPAKENKIPESKISAPNEVSQAVAPAKSTEEESIKAKGQDVSKETVAQEEKEPQINKAGEKDLAPQIEKTEETQAHVEDDEMQTKW